LFVKVHRYANSRYLVLMYIKHELAPDALF